VELGGRQKAREGEQRVWCRVQLDQLQDHLVEFWLLEGPCALEGAILREKCL
jgi:hypothetical protein